MDSKWRLEWRSFDVGLARRRQPIMDRTRWQTRWLRQWMRKNTRMTGRYCREHHQLFRKGVDCSSHDQHKKTSAVCQYICKNWWLSVSFKGVSFGSCFPYIIVWISNVPYLVQLFACCCWCWVLNDFINFLANECNIFKSTFFLS